MIFLPHVIVTIFAENPSLLFQVCIQFITVEILYSIMLHFRNILPGYINDSETSDIFKGKI